MTPEEGVREEEGVPQENGLGEERAGREGGGLPGGRGVSLGVLVAVVALQVAVMMAVFNPAPHSGGDNAGYLTLAYSLLERGAYLELWDPAAPPHTKYPPVFPVLLAALMLLGARSWIVFKGLVALFTTLSVVAAWGWIRERRGPLFAGGVALALIFSEAFLWSSHWILSDPLFVALTLLSLWALERSGRNGPGKTLWLVTGAGMAILAYFTRSAGLPLVAAVGVWLALERRWRAVAGFAAAFGVPALLWWLRGRGIVEGAYLSEFLLVDPYRPHLGRADLLDLARRVGDNLVAYVTVHIPGGLTGFRGSRVAVLGVVTALLATGGWLGRVVDRVRPAELFVPLYFGVVLFWPQVWSGDRFALPLYPFVLFYAGEALLAVGAWIPRLRGRRAAGGLAVAGLALFVVPAVSVWRTSSREVRLCVEVMRTEGPFGCYGDRMWEFARAARWSGINLPEEGAAVLSRKPRLFYALSAIPSRSFPLSDDPEDFFRAAEGAGARYVVLDYLDTVSRLYLVPVVTERAGAFCYVLGWGDPAVGRTQLLGILPPERHEALVPREEEEDGSLVMDLRVCSGDMLADSPRREPPGRGMTVPLLRRLDQASPDDP